MKQTSEYYAYPETTAPQFHLARHFIKECGFSEEESFLDIGCGDGRTTNFLASLTPNRVVGIDRAEDMIHFATRASSVYRHLEFIKADAELFDLGQFDVVTCLFCANLIADLDQMFFCIKKALKQGGRVIMLIPAASNLFYESNSKLLDNLSSTHKTKSREIHDYQSAFLKFGLHPTMLKEEEVSYQFDNQASFKAWLASRLDCLKILPEGEIEPFLSQAIGQYETYLTQKTYAAVQNLFIFRLFKIILKANT